VSKLNILRRELEAKPELDSADNESAARIMATVEAACLPPGSEDNLDEVASTLLAAFVLTSDFTPNPRAILKYALGVIREDHQVAVRFQRTGR
jgi:hypothetical protein